ncbi:hypothetical protein PAXRUDRAFT_78012, partial [Paxillus rubicundulus Ve08.2h10]
MGQGQKVAPELQWAVIQLSRLLNHNQIATCLKLSTHSIRHIISRFNIHGLILDQTNDKDPDESNPRSYVDVEFLLGTIQKTSDLYLDELQEMLVTSCGVEVLHSMVWHALHRVGFTMKK